MKEKLRNALYLKNHHELHFKMYNPNILDTRSFTVKCEQGGCTTLCRNDTLPKVTIC